MKLENVGVKLKNVRLKSVKLERFLVRLSRRMTRQGICSCICLVLATVRLKMVRRQSINTSVGCDLKIIDLGNASSEKGPLTRPGRARRHSERIRSEGFDSEEADFGLKE